MYDELVKKLRNYASFTAIPPMSVDLSEAADAIEELSKRVDESIPKDDAEIIIAEVAKPRWIPVTERLPLLMTPVLITDGIEVDIAWMFGVPARWAAQYTDMDADSITHWMELPQTPKEEQT